MNHLSNDNNFRLYNKGSNRKEPDNDVIFPIIQTEISQKKKSFIKLAKNIKINSSINKNYIPKDFLNKPYLNSEAFNKPVDKYKFGHYFNNISENLSEKKIIRQEGHHNQHKSKSE
jgi:hypothetical protein